MRWGVLLLIATGCRSLLGFDPVSDTESCVVTCATAADCPGGLTCGAEGLCVDPGGICAAGDGGIDSDGCVGTGLVKYCMPFGITEQTLAGTIDTDVDGRCEYLTFDGVNTCVIAAASTINTKNVRAIGQQPLVLVAGSTINVEGLDVSNNRTAGSSAAGTNQVACSNGSNGGDSVNGGGGAAGGSFQGRGGKGGSNSATVGGIGAPVFGTPTRLEGGCSSGHGGIRNGSGPAAVAALPGGIVYLAAGSTIAISGTINASGAGGNSAPKNGGGGGGGSGGLIGLDAPTISVMATGRVLALGGGGGGGGSASDPGPAGNDPNPNGSDIASIAAPGANGASGAGNGGRGSSLLNDGGNGANGADNDAGGGGGGGGSGYIVVFGSLQGLTGSIVLPIATQ